MIDPPILLEPGLRYAGIGVAKDGRQWIKFINTGAGRVRTVIVYIAAAEFTYHYAIRDTSTNTILGYEGPNGDPTKDESYIWGTRDLD